MVHSPRANSSSSFCGQCKSFLLESELSRKYLKFTSNQSFSIQIRSSSYFHTLFSLLGRWSGTSSKHFDSFRTGVKVDEASSWNTRRGRRFSSY